MAYETAVHPMDMHLYRDKFSTSEMRAIFSEANIVQKRLDVEATLAEAQAEMGIIPAAAAVEIRRVANLDHMTLEEYSDAYARKGHDLVALVWLLASKCTDGFGEYVHWRSTTQDILWTSTALLYRDALRVLNSNLRELEGEMVQLIEKHRLTLMAGRTHGQHCPPITFGFYLAILASAVRRHIDRLKEVESRLLVGKVTGAVGTAASYGDDAEPLQRLICEKLGLQVPAITESEATRDRVAELCNLCSLIATTCEKLARDIWTLQRPEIGELAEPFRTGDQVGSSTLPHKRNPFACEWVQGVAKMVRANAYPVNELFVFDVRDGTRLAVEYSCIPSSLMMTSAAVTSMAGILRGLTVNASNMRRNLDVELGLSMDEPVMLRLADAIGRQSAHDLIYECSMEAFESRRPIREVLVADPRVTVHIAPEEIDRLMRYENYIGTVPAQIDAVLAHIHTARSAEESRSGGTAITGDGAKGKR